MRISPFSYSCNPSLALDSSSQAMKMIRHMVHSRAFVLESALANLRVLSAQVSRESLYWNLFVWFEMKRGSLYEDVDARLKNVV